MIAHLVSAAHIQQPIATGTTIWLTDLMSVRKQTKPVHSATRAELMNLSPALLTTEFHSACSNAAPSTAD